MAVKCISKYTKIVFSAPAILNNKNCIAASKCVCTKQANQCCYFFQTERFRWQLFLGLK